jgi:tight adherence protein B
VFPPRYRLVVAALAVVSVLLMLVWWTLPIQVAIAGAAVVAVLAQIVETAIAERRMQQVESQLTEAVDLMVASLRAGSALLASFEAALREARPPLKPYLQEVVGRVRLGDDPREAIDALTRQVPLDGVRLFATSLAVNWEAGGSLATTLASVGRTVRDRIDLARRIRTQGIEANVSVGIVMFIAYLLGFLMWRTSPDRMEAFVKSEAGTDLVALVIGLQAAGLIWMSRLSRGDL